MKRMRSVLAMMLAVLMVFGLLAGCSSDKTPDPTPANSSNPQQSSEPEQSKEPEVVRTDLNAQLFTDPISMDPQMITSSYDGSVAMQIYDPLFESPDGDYENLQPCLCTSYEVNENATEYIFTIREGVPFQNGDILTAEDVTFTINRLRTSPATATTYGCLAGAETVDEHTVKVTCNYPVYRLPQMLSGYTAGIVNKKLIEQYGDSAQETIVGTGAYKLTEWVPGYGIKLEAYNEGWRGAPFIQTVNYTVILDTNAARIAFQNGELDSFYASSASDMELLINDYNSEAYTIATEDHLAFNTSRAWCDNLQFRQAVAYAIDREALVEICSGGLWAVAESIVAPGNIAYREDLKYPYEYNPEKAKELLAACGYDGTEVGLLYTSSYPVSNTWGTTVEAYLRAVGINVRMDGYDYSNVVSRVVGRDYDMCLFEFAVSYADPLSSYYALYRSDGYYNVWQYFSEEMDARILSMYAMDNEALTAETQAIDAWAQEQCLYVPCYQQGGYVFRPDNISSDATPEPMFGNIRLCYSKWLTSDEVAQLKAEKEAEAAKAD